MYIQLLGTDNGETSPSIYIFFADKRYLINVGEGTQRFCTEHKIRLSKIQNIFLTRIDPSTVGGLPGAILTLSDMGAKDLNVYGPSGIRPLLNAAQPFMYRPNLNLQRIEYSNEPPPFQDNNLSILPIVLDVRTLSDNPSDTFLITFKPTPRFHEI